MGECTGGKKGRSKSWTRFVGGSSGLDDWTGRSLTASRRDGTEMDSGRDFINGTGRYCTTGVIFKTGRDGKVRWGRVSLRNGTARDDGTILTTVLPSRSAVAVPFRQYTVINIEVFLLTLVVKVNNSGKLRARRAK